MLKITVEIVRFSIEKGDFPELCQRLQRVVHGSFKPTNNLRFCVMLLSLTGNGGVPILIVSYKTILALWYEGLASLKYITWAVSWEYRHCCNCQGIFMNYWATRNSHELPICLEIILWIKALFIMAWHFFAVMVGNHGNRCESRNSDWGDKMIL